MASTDNSIGNSGSKCANTAAADVKVYFTAQTAFSHLCDQFQDVVPFPLVTSTHWATAWPHVVTLNLIYARRRTFTVRISSKLHDALPRFLVCRIKSVSFCDLQANGRVMTTQQRYKLVKSLRIRRFREWQIKNRFKTGFSRNAPFVEVGCSFSSLPRRHRSLRRRIKSKDAKKTGRRLPRYIDSNVIYENEADKR